MRYDVGNMRYDVGNMGYELGGRRYEVGNMRYEIGNTKEAKSKQLNTRCFQHDKDFVILKASYICTQSKRKLC